MNEIKKEKPITIEKYEDLFDDDGGGNKRKWLNYVLQ
jgi:ribosomal protein S17E